MAKNMGRGEAVFRVVSGAILIVLAFLTQGGLRWILGAIGVIVVMTALFGY